MEIIINLAKMLLEIDVNDDTQNELLMFFLVKAQNTISNYLGIDDISSYTNQTVDLAVYYYNNRDCVGVTSVTQGNRSKTIKDGIPDNIKQTLPKPKLKVLGG